MRAPLIVLFLVTWVAAIADLAWVLNIHSDAAATSERGQSPVRVVPGGGTLSDEPGR